MTNDYYTKILPSKQKIMTIQSDKYWRNSIITKNVENLHCVVFHADESWTLKQSEFLGEACGRKYSHTFNCANENSNGFGCSRPIRSCQRRIFMNILHARMLFTCKNFDNFSLVVKTLRYDEVSCSWVCYQVIIQSSSVLASEATIMIHFLILALFVAPNLGARIPKGIFSVVQFSNEACDSSDNAYNGTCLTSDECTAAGGSAKGTCAQGEYKELRIVSFHYST